MRLYEIKAVPAIGRSVVKTEQDFFNNLDSIRLAIRQTLDDNIIYRGLGTVNIAYLEPGKYSRLPKQNQNYQMLMIDNNPMWARFPKRAQSIIGSNDHRYASTFGEAHVVFPVSNGSDNIAIAPTSDIYDSFDMETPAFNNLVLDLTKWIGGVNLAYNVTWDTLHSALEEVDLNNPFKYPNSSVRLYDIRPHLKTSYHIVETILQRPEPVEQVLFKKLAPTHFSLVSYQDYSNPEHDAEIWFNTPTWVVPSGIWYDWVTDPEKLKLLQGG